MQQSKKTQGGGRATKPAAISKKATSSLRAASTPSSNKATPRSQQQTAAQNGKSDSRVANRRALKDGSEMGRQGSRFDGGILKNRSGAGGTTQPGKPLNKEGSTRTQGRNAKSAVAKNANAGNGANRATQASKSSKGASSRRAKSGK